MTDIPAHITGTVWKIECRGRRRDRGGRRRGDPRVDEDGDAGRGRGRRHRRSRSGARRASRSARATRSSCSSSTVAGPPARAGELLVDEPAAGRHAADDLQPGQAQRARPPDPRRDHGSAADAAASANAARCVIITGAHGMFSAGYDIGEIPDEEFEERAEALVAHPFTEAIEALEAYPAADARGARRATRSAAGSSSRSRATCESRASDDQARDAARQARAGLLPHRAAALHRRDRRGAHARAVPDRRATSTRRPRSPGASSTASCPRPSSSRATLALAGELAGNAPLSQRGQQARDRRAAATREAQLAAGRRAELIELRRASFASEDMREGMRAFAEKRAPPVWRGE